MLKLAKTQNYGLPIIPESEAGKTKFIDWRKSLTGDTPSSAMNIIDKALAEAQGSVTWRRCLGEGLLSMDVFAAPTLQEAQSCNENDLVTITPASIAPQARMALSEQPEPGFSHHIREYTANIRPGAQFVSLRTGSSAFTNQEKSLYNGDTLECSGPASGVGTVVLKPGLQPNEISIATHPVGMSSDDPQYDSVAQVYRLSIQKHNAQLLQNLWVSDKSTDGNANHYNCIWSIDDTHPGTTNYEATPPLVDLGTHDIYVKNTDACHYGVMVEVLQTYIYLNVEAPGLDGDTYYLTISEHGAKNPQVVTTKDNPDKPGSITNAEFRLDPSKNGTQVFQFTITNRSTGEEGAYYLTIFRDQASDPTKLVMQTYLKGCTHTANTWGATPDHSVDLTLYRKSDSMGLLTVDELVAALLADGGMTAADAGDHYTDRFEAIKTMTDSDGVKYLDPIWSGKSEMSEGGFLIAPQIITSPGIYMVVSQRNGYLDVIIDNLLIYKIWVAAEYDLHGLVMRAGDVNHDGIINEKDQDLYGHYYEQYEAAGTLNDTTKIIDFNGDGKLTNSDLSYILSQMYQTSNIGNRLDNIHNIRFRSILKNYDETINY